MTLTKKQQNKVLATLDQLDHDNDEHWNKDGSPTVSVVAELAALPQLTKADIHDIAPDFKRAVQEPKTEQSQDNANGDAAQGNAPTNPEQDQDPEQDRELTELERVERQLAAARDLLDNAISNVTKAQLEQQRCQNIVHHLELRLSRMTHAHRDTSAATVAGYLQSQQRVRAEQEAQYARMKEEGKIGKPRSQLDKAMARRQGYGHQRMVMPPLFAGKK